MPAETFNDVIWGSVRLWCASITTSNGRNIVVHELAEGDDHPTQDRGLAVRRTTCELLFVEMPSEKTSALERLRAFLAQIEDGEELLFSHPIDDPYFARVEDFHYTLDDDGNVSDASCVFVKSGEAEAPSPAGAGS